MNETAIVYAKAEDSVDAARDICEQLTKSLGSEPVDVIILFASPRYDHRVLLESIHERCTAWDAISSMFKPQMANGRDRCCCRHE